MTMPSPIHSHPTGMSELDFELAALLDTLSLQQKFRTASQPAAAPAPPTVTAASDIQMNDDAGTSQSGTTASSSSSDAPRSATTPAPCAFLGTLTHSYDPDAAADADNSEEAQVQTTCGEYLDLILIHRELFAAHPPAHVGCSAAFTALARSLELRAWRADRDADTEAIVAFRHEAWMVAAWMSSGGPWWRSGEKMAE